MASYWKSTYLGEALEDGFQEFFKQPNQEQEEEHFVVTFYKSLVKKVTSEKDFESGLECIMAGWKFLVTTPHEGNRSQLFSLIDSLCLASRHVFLTGEWMQQTNTNKDFMETTLGQCGRCFPQRKTEIEKIQTMAREPWGSSRVKNLLTGKTELQQQVLELVSSEGVDLVLLRIEMLIESGLDSAAYKFVAAVANSLLADHIVFQSYVFTSKPGTLERIVDIFMGLAVATRRESRLYTLLKLIGIEDVNQVYIQRFNLYLNPPTAAEVNGKSPEPVVKVEPSDSAMTHDGDSAMTDVSKETSETTKDQTGGGAVKKGKGEEGEEGDKTDRLLLCSLGRCQRLFTEKVCRRVLEVLFQWSLAGASVKECSDTLQTRLIQEWLEKCSSNKEKLVNDVDVLTEAATQTTFLYTLAHKLWQKFGAEAEERSLKMFIRGLTADINAQEAARKTRTVRLVVEERMARGFWLLSKVIHDRPALARECVLTAFSIKPCEEKFEKIREMATASGLDKIKDPDCHLEDSLEELEEANAGLHCRPILEDGEDKNPKGFTKLYMAKMRKHLENVHPAEVNFTTLKQIDTSDQLLNQFFQDLVSDLDTGRYSKADTKLRHSKGRQKKKFRNLEGILSIQGELITEAENYNPLDEPCVSLKPDNLKIAKPLIEDILIVVSAPRWHLLSWVLNWTELEQTCIRLLKDPTIREPNEELKFLNIDYTQFDEWSSDEELTIYTGIEKGYEKWLETPDQTEEEARFTEKGLSSGEEEGITFDSSHTVDREDYDDLDKYLGPGDYLPPGLNKAASEGKDNLENVEETPMEVSENFKDEFCQETSPKSSPFAPPVETSPTKELTAENAETRESDEEKKASDQLDEKMEDDVVEKPSEEKKGVEDSLTVPEGNEAEEVKEGKKNDGENETEAMNCS